MISSQVSILTRLLLFEVQENGLYFTNRGELGHKFYILNILFYLKVLFHYAFYQ